MTHSPEALRAPAVDTPADIHASNLELTADNMPLEWAPAPKSGIGVGLAALGCASTSLDDAARSVLSNKTDPEASDA